jgi:hypothetical protein
MSDVRLTATNPTDSSVVAVACNARGELLTVAPVIEKIPNDVEIEGDLTVTGTINGDNGGESGLPAPGPEGSILAIENGAPAWIGKSDLCAPEPEPRDPLMLVDRTGENNGNHPSYGCWSIAQQVVSSPGDWDTYVKGLSTFDSPQGIKTGCGTEFFDGENKDMYVSLDLQGGEGKVLEFTFATLWSGTPNQSYGTVGSASLSTESDKLQSISTQDSFDIDGSSFWREVSFSFLVTRPDLNRIDFTLTAQSLSSAYVKPLGAWLQSWKYVDSSYYLICKEIDRNKKITEALSKVGSTTDIDLLRRL